MEPITREESFLAKAAGQNVKTPEPITRTEMFLAKMAGMDVKTPEPITREEMFLQQAIENGGTGGGAAPVIEALTVTENGTYSAPEGVDGYNPVTVNVASSGGDDLKGIIERTATTINVPSGITKIGDYMFYKYTKLNSVTLPDSVTSIGNYAFQNCGNMRLSSLPSGLTSIGSYAFDGCAYMATQISFPSGLTSIGNYAFQRCSNLNKVSFPSSLTSIGDYTFYGCSYLKTINVPWAEGAVSGAPWGATNATINYNYTGG